MALVVLGVALVVLGVFLLWTASRGGTEWNSTHDRLGRSTPRVGSSQQRLNRIAGLVGGLITIGAGAVSVVLGVTLR